MTRNDRIASILFFAMVMLALIVFSLAVFTNAAGDPVVAAQGEVPPDARIDFPGISKDVLLYEVEVNERTCIVAIRIDTAIFCEENR